MRRYSKLASIYTKILTMLYALLKSKSLRRVLTLLPTWQTLVSSTWQTLVSPMHLQSIHAVSISCCTEMFVAVVVLKSLVFRRFYLWATRTCLCHTWTTHLCGVSSLSAGMPSQARGSCFPLNGEHLLCRRWVGYQALLLDFSPASLNPSCGFCLLL